MHMVLIDAPGCDPYIMDFSGTVWSVITDNYCDGGIQNTWTWEFYSDGSVNQGSHYHGSWETENNQLIVFWGTIYEKIRYVGDVNSSMTEVTGTFYYGGEHCLDATRNP
jgi:hypothetical protein